MSTELVVGIAIVLLLVLLAIEVPVPFALAGSGAAGLILLSSVQLAGTTLASAPWNAVGHYTLSIIPLYILLGMFAVHGKLAERVYGMGATALRFLPGGLGIATVAACTGFAAVSGSSLATAASLGKISIGEMRRVGYKASFASGIVAIGGTLGILIPPSVAMVMYGIVARESIGQLLAAGIVPGVLSAVAYAVYIFFVAGRNIVPPEKGLAEAVHAAAGREGEVPDRTRMPKGGVRALLWLAAIFAVILAGMFTGFVTVTESAAIGALVALVMLFFENVRDGIKRVWDLAREAARESASVSAMALMLLIGAGVFSTFLVQSRLPYKLAGWIGELSVPPIVVVIIILLILIPLGMFLDSLSVIIIVVPLVHPIVTELGFSGVWFAVLFVMLLEIGLVTPPVGMNTFVVAAAAKLPLGTVFKGVTPFLIPAFVMVALVLIFPDLALWLPSFSAG
ncbi:TRAP transporter large permease [Microbacterium sp. No. 7]|uniref:TRAP transporter large permease n=1 Tax=Microbacterium sp. No. 7 TaxID=1714373 RepID=UPI0006D09030|nr:TRAP transporter large permease [Microbacterium sp. No. 7]ALJ19276.1 hypothetical protein AOA12_04900 [Microbacterium sp. No. 7]